MWVEFNPNYKKRRGRAGDCSVRAVAKALNISWDRAFVEIAVAGFIIGDVQSSNPVWGEVLRWHGFHRKALPDSCPDCYTAEDFCRDHPEGVYVLGFGNHAACVESGNLYDAWDSSEEYVQYYWFRKDDSE